MSRFNAEAILKLAREMSTLEICAICEEEIKRQIMSAKGGNTLSSVTMLLSSTSRR